jgi:hypothetical protein
MVSTQMTEVDVKIIRTRSVDNLQRLYTVVISLAITESLRNLLSDVVSKQPPGYERWLMFISLLVTVVPFYHGANRYLDATYVTLERRAHDEALMIDFLILFVEGLCFFAIAALAPLGPVLFYTGLAFLFVLDAAWVGITNLTALRPQDRFTDYFKWAFANVIAAAALLISVWTKVFYGTSFWRTELAGNIALAVVAVSRTFYDYWKVWRFYYPKGVEVGGVIPAPAPAPVPHLPHATEPQSPA